MRETHETSLHLVAWQAEGKTTPLKLGDFSALFNQLMNPTVLIFFGFDVNFAERIQIPWKNGTFIIHHMQKWQVLLQNHVCECACVCVQ